MPGRPLVVVIPTRARPDLLERTLASLAHARRPDTYRETRVVENGPRDPRVPEVTARWKESLRVQLFSYPDGNKSAALNAVLTDLAGAFVVFLDDDVRVDGAVLEAYARAEREAGPHVFFGGPTSVDYEVEPPSWLRSYLPPSAVGWDWKGDAAHVDAPEFLGFNWAARVDDLQVVGGFDAAFGPGARTGATGQERDMQCRLLEAGWHGQFVPEARVWHYVPRSRCSRGWALRRAYRNGISLGLSEPQEGARRLGGVPRWMLRVALTKAVRMVGSQFRLSAERRFVATRDLLVHVGRLRGLRMRMVEEGHR